MEAAAAGSGGSGAATKLQKVYRSYRTRRRLADSAVVVEGLWWKALDFARLNYNTISFFDEPKPKTAASHWNRISQNALKVGHGLSREDKALKLAFEHWIEAIDSRHRSGHNLHSYYNLWCQSQAGQPFFYWLDVGDGKDVDLPECPRTLLKKQCIRYLGPKERELYEYIINEGKIIHKHSGEPLDTRQGPKGAYWIFVMSTTRRLYAGKKEKGVFQHSSFLAGGATIAAGKFTVKAGVIKSIWAYSGHYKPSTEDLRNFMKFLEENGVNVKEIEVIWRLDLMAVASRLAVARVSPEGACPAAAGRRSGLAAFLTARIGTRRGGAVAASPPRCTVEAVEMTEPLTKEDLVAYLVPRCKPKENWRFATY